MLIAKYASIWGTKRAARACGFDSGLKVLEGEKLGKCCMAFAIKYLKRSVEWSNGMEGIRT